MIETIAVIIIVLAALIFIIRSVVKSTHSPTGGCQYCTKAASCTACNINNKENIKEKK